MLAACSGWPKDVGPNTASLHVRFRDDFQGVLRLNGKIFPLSKVAPQSFGSPVQARIMCLLGRGPVRQSFGVT